MEVDNNEEKLEKKEKEKKEKKNSLKSFKRIGLLLIILILVVFGIKMIILNKDGDVKNQVKTILDRVVQKSELETVTITYNVIAKKCKDENNCDKSSNNIKDFKYVVSCQGTITAGIDFDKVKVEVDESKKNIIIHIPEASIKGDPNILSINFLNGNELSASELTNARNLCQETTKERSQADGKLIPAATEQAKIVLEGFYKQWVKAFDSSYTVEIR